MRKFIILAAATITLASCDKTEVRNLNHTKDSLTNALSAKDSIINEAFFEIDEIASSLNQIAIRENLISQDATGEISKSKKDQIADNIAAISLLLDKNREALVRLNSTTKKLSAANIEVSGLKKLIVSLQKQIENKDIQISALTEELEDMNEQLQDLSESVAELKEDKTNLEIRVADQSAKLTDHVEQLNTVHYIVGSEKELMEKNIIDKKGLIGRTGVVGSNLNDLQPADIRELDRINVGRKKVKFITNHPEGSYLIVENEDKLVEEIVITDKKKFWSASKILIVTYK